MRRTAPGHLRHPTIEGASLCGEVLHLVPCAACLARLAALLLVHVQSTRKPDMGFCGVVLRGGGIAPMGTPGAQPSPMYVAADQARTLIAAAARDRESGADRDGHLPFCPGCEENLGRFDEAVRRRSARIEEDRLEEDREVDRRASDDAGR